MNKIEYTFTALVKGTANGNIFPEHVQVLHGSSGLEVTISEGGIVYSNSYK